ncbi:glycosyltransferase involved in cell wall biosynthesis [Bacillus tianshenii]|uniref:Glycosyltransferase involved in cell wall biosynthesis n=2 Tax=Sutcliffiella tianshenii TaxID=1463404 RepID=A0ABS2NV50_9BACI|nr:glycosyltransferase involved in cell wall biosynthesis [Bacillus tianshenii]
MIIKDEEKVLNRCLDSVKDIVDEIIVIDTGSTDNSKKVAALYTEKIYDYCWNDDFSKARNFAASKASGKWIIVLDADEYVDKESFMMFKKDLEEKEVEENIFITQIVNFMGVEGEGTSLNYHERIYRNNSMIYYYRSVHEMLKHSDSKEVRGIASFQIFHTGYLESNMKKKRDSQRNLNILKMKRAKEPMDYYFLGNEYYSLKKYDLAISYYKKGFQKKKSINSDWIPKLLVKLISSLQLANRHQEAKNIINDSMKVYPSLVDFKYLKGKMYLDQKKNNKAILIFEDVLAKKEKFQANFSEDFLEYLPHGHLGELYEETDEFNLAVHHYSKAISLNDQNNYLWVRLITLLAKKSSIEDIINFLNNNVLTRKSMTYKRFATIILSVPILEVRQLILLLDFSNELTPLEKESIELKSYLLHKKINLIAEQLTKKSVTEINIILNGPVFKLIDLIYISIKSDSNYLKSVLYEICKEKAILNILDSIFKGKSIKINEKEEKILRALYIECDVYDDKELIQILNNRKYRRNITTQLMR